jgi:hypothetical protein
LNFDFVEVDILRLEGMPHEVETRRVKINIVSVARRTIHDDSWNPHGAVIYPLQKNPASLLGAELVIDQEAIRHKLFKGVKCGLDLTVEMGVAATFVQELSNLVLFLRSIVDDNYVDKTVATSLGGHGYTP